MALALTRIKVDKDKFIEVGEEVTGFNDETMEQLVAAGAVGDAEDLDAVTGGEASRQKIAELEAELERYRSEFGPLEPSLGEAAERASRTAHGLPPIPDDPTDTTTKETLAGSGTEPEEELEPEPEPEPDL